VVTLPQLPDDVVVLLDSFTARTSENGNGHRARLGDLIALRHPAISTRSSFLDVLYRGENTPAGWVRESWEWLRTLSSSTIFSSERQRLRLPRQAAMPVRFAADSDRDVLGADGLLAERLPTAGAARATGPTESGGAGPRDDYERFVT
jgi:hypothetical protein